jgi:hypothetical protein
MRFSGLFFHRLHADCCKLKGLIKPALLLAISALWLFGFVLERQSETFQRFEAALLSLQWTLPVCLVVWCGAFLLLTFNPRDLPLIGLLAIAVVWYFLDRAGPSMDGMTLLFGVTMGKGLRYALSPYGSSKMEDGYSFQVRNFLIGLIILLAFASWWHLDMTGNLYHGPRWMGLWDNPNDYGVLMSVGLVLGIGLLAEIWSPEFAIRSYRRAFSYRPLLAILVISVGLMGIGLLFSYSRGAWVGTVFGLLYLTKAYGKIKWRSPKLLLFSAFWFLALIFVVWFFWNNTPDSAPWYIKRLDLSRGSVQHRLVAWNGGFEFMRDHPLGLGWGKAFEIYRRDYSPHDRGAAALFTNSYLMIGIQLGVPALICFVVYGVFAVKKQRRARQAEVPSLVACDLSIQAACRAGVLVCLVAFWFDGGLFKMATGSIFWILLELGKTEIPSSIRLRLTTARQELQAPEKRQDPSAKEEKVAAGQRISVLRGCPHSQDARAIVCVGDAGAVEIEGEADVRNRGQER